HIFRNRLTPSWLTTCRPLSHYQTTPPTKLHTLSLHDALPISRFDITSCVTLVPSKFSARYGSILSYCPLLIDDTISCRTPRSSSDRKSTRLNSSHDQISYAVFCLKKKINVKYCSGSL